MKRRKRLITLAAVCSSFFLLTACDQGASRSSQSDDANAPTFGAPDRGESTQPGTAPDTGTAPQQSAPSTTPDNPDQDMP